MRRQKYACGLDSRSLNIAAKHRGAIRSQGGEDHRPSRARAIASASAYGCELLEARRLLTGTWAPLTNAVPSAAGAQTMLLLSDGTVMAQAGADSASSAWNRLTPVQGNYTTGHWTALASMHVGRLFYASDMLPSGKVLVLGGEVATDKNETNTGEIYDPVGNTWTVIANFPEANFGDGMSEVLSDGRVLAASEGSSNSYIYNPANNTWSGAIPSYLGDQFSEEGWVKLADGSLLDYQIGGGNPQGGARFVLGATDAQDAWVAAGNVPVRLDSNGGDNSIVPELGPGFRLPDGRVLWIGATSSTAFYTPSTNTWTAGQTIPSALGAIDAPGAVLPNGRVLFAASPHVITGGGSPTFASPTTIFEYDPIANTITAVSNTNGPNLNAPAFIGRMLVLPSGQVLYSNGSSTENIYTPDSGPNSAWAPTISNITNDSGTNTFTLTGTQLNGLSEGSAYGDDAQMASNYPIVQLTDQAGNISFARTFNWSSTGVATGGTTETVNFTVPGGLGAYLVNVIANGIASAAALDIQCSVASGENFFAQPNANANYVDIAVSNGGGAVATFWIGSFSELILTGDAASNTLVINCNLFGRGTVIDGGDGNDFLRVETDGTGTITEYGGNGNDYFDFSFYARNLSNDNGFTYVYGTAGTNSIFVYDNNYATNTTYTVDQAEVNRPGFGGFFYDAVIAGLAVNTGTGTDTVNVPSTYYATPVYLYGNATETINVGSGGSVQGIAAALTVENSPAYLALNVDDSADSGSRTVTMGTYTPGGDTAFGYIAGLASGNINYEFADTSSVSVATGTGTNNVVNILNTGVTTTLNGGGGSRTVNIGNGTQGVQGITGTLVLNASSGYETVNIDDTADSAARTTTLDNAVVNGYTSERIADLAPVLIEFYLSGTTALSIKTSQVNGNITNILVLSTATSIIGEVNTASDDVVNIGNAGSLAGVTGALTITNPSGYTDIVLNDYTDTYYVNYTFSSFTQSGTPWGKLVFPTYTLYGVLTIYNTLNYTAFDIATVTVNVGSSTTASVQNTAVPIIINEPSGGSNSSSVALTANVQATTASLTINTSNDDWTVNAGNAGSVQGLLGPVNVTSSGFGSLGSVVVDDSADAVPRTVTVTASQITGLAPAAISYPQFRTVWTINGGTGGNNFTVTTTPVGGLYNTNTLNSGDGNDTVIVDATQASFSSGQLVVNAGNGNDSVTVGAGSLSTFNSPVTLNGGAGTDSLLLADQTVAANDAYTITSTTVTRPNFSLTYSGLESMDLEAETGNNVISVNGTAVGTPVAINANAGTDTINVNQTDPTAPVTILPSIGNDAVNVDTTASPGATALFAASQQIGVLTIGNGGVARVTTGAKKLLQLSSVAASGNGVLDMTTNDLIVHSATLSAVNAQVKSGFNSAGGYWNGPGITSSSAAGNPKFLTALGTILNTYDGGVHTLFNAANPFDGVSPSITDVLVKYTYYGDANLSGVVDGSDYSRIDGNMGGVSTGWFNGDFNYDQKVNGSDYTLIDNAFNTQGASLAAVIATPAAEMTSAKSKVAVHLPVVKHLVTAVARKLVIKSKAARHLKHPVVIRHRIKD